MEFVAFQGEADSFGVDGRVRVERVIAKERKSGSQFCERGFKFCAICCWDWNAGGRKRFWSLGRNENGKEAEQKDGAHQQR